MTAAKTHVITAQRPGTPGCAFIRSIGRDGSWLCTWNLSSARRFSADQAEKQVAALNAATACAVFEHRETSPA